MALLDATLLGPKKHTHHSEMASMAPLPFLTSPPPFLSKPRPSSFPLPKAVPNSNSQTTKDLFIEAKQRCMDFLTTQSATFTAADFHALPDTSPNLTKVKGTVIATDANGAVVDVDVGGKPTSAWLSLHEACMHRITHVAEAGMYPGLREEFVVVGENGDGTLVLSVRVIQRDLAWRRCRQLMEEDAVVVGKVVAKSRGGVVPVVEGLRGFVPYSHISKKSNAEELINKELALKFMEVDQEHRRLFLSNELAMVEWQAQLETGSVVQGIVRRLTPYGAFVDIGGITGLLHVSQISHYLVSDIATVLHPGDTLKVMILSHDRERERLSLSTKKLEPTPGDMIYNRKLVFEKADEVAEIFRQRMAEAEKMAHTNMLRSESEMDSARTAETMSILKALEVADTTGCSTYEWEEW